MKTPDGKRLPVHLNKFHQGSAADGKHYWLTPASVYEALDQEFHFDCDPAPHPLPPGYDGLTAPWGQSSYLNPPFGAILHEGRRKGVTAWVRKALAEQVQGKTVVLVYPCDKWLLMLLQAGAEVRNLGDVKWLATEDGSAGPGMGRHIGCFILRGEEQSMHGMGSHHSPTNESDEWLTPPDVLAPLGRFDLDPCAAPEPRPWPTAYEHFVREQDGLSLPWWGRVWLNSPYGGPSIVGPWLRKMVRHGHGTALIFARTETELFWETVWQAATAVLFLKGRLVFCRPDGVPAAHNGGAPSCLVAYGTRDAEILAKCGLPGKFIQLR